MKKLLILMLVCFLGQTVIAQSNSTENAERVKTEYSDNGIDSKDSAKCSSKKNTNSESKGCCKAKKAENCSKNSKKTEKCSKSSAKEKSAAKCSKGESCCTKTGKKVADCDRKSQGCCKSNKKPSI